MGGEVSGSAQARPCWETPAPAPAAPLGLVLGLGPGLGLGLGLPLSLALALVPASPRLPPARLSPMSAQAPRPLHPPPQAGWHRPTPPLLIGSAVANGVAVVGGQGQPGPVLTELACARCPPSAARSSASRDTGPAERRPSRRAVSPGAVLSAAQGVCTALPSLGPLTGSGPAQGGRGGGKGGGRGGELPWMCSASARLSQNGGLPVLQPQPWAGGAAGRAPLASARPAPGGRQGCAPGPTARAEPSTQGLPQAWPSPGAEEERRPVLAWPRAWSCGQKEGRTEPPSLSPGGLTTVLRFCPRGSPALAGPAELQSQANAGAPGAPGVQGSFGHLRG